MIPVILASQFLAPWMAIGFPSFHSLEVVSVKKYPRELTTNYYSYLVLSEPQELPKRMIIKGRLSKKDGCGTFIIGIDLENNIIESATWNTLLNKPYYGSAEIGIVIFGLPGLIISFPFIIAIYNLYWLAQKLSGMNKDSLSIYLKLRNQLSKEDKLLLKNALKNYDRSKQNSI